MITQWLTLLFLMLVIGLWLAAMRSRDLALHAARGICRSQDVQLLDESIGLSGLRLQRRQDGRLQWTLRYAFEVSQDGHDRYAGYVWMAGGRVIAMHGNWPSPASGALDVNSKVAELMRRIGHRDQNGAT
jgi:hypothetical protein